MIKKVKNIVPYVVNNLNGEEMLLRTLTGKKLLERFTKTNCKNQIKKSLELKK